MWLGLLFSWCQDSPHDRRVQLVLALFDIAGFIAHPEDKDRQCAFLVEVLRRDRDRQDSAQAVLAISSLVAMLADVPCKDAGLIIVVGQAVVGTGQQAEILRNVLAAILYLVQHEESDEPLTFSVLG